MCVAASKKVCEKMISQTNKDEIVSYMVRGKPYGKYRVNRLFRKKHRSFVVAMDHPRVFDVITISNILI